MPAVEPAVSESVQSKCTSERGVLRSALGMYLGLPRKVQLALLTVVVGAVCRLAGVDSAIVRALVGTVAEETRTPAERSEALDEERADGEALEGVMVTYPVPHEETRPR